MTCIVTGAAGGIGRAVVQRLRDQGERVMRLDLDPAVADVADPDPESYRVVDATDVDALAEVCRTVGPISGVVAAAGVSRPGASAQYPRSDWDLIVDLNLRATFDLMRLAAPFAVDGASFVAISSISGHQGFGGRAAYCASKAGVEGLVRSLAIEYAPTIRVNAVAPGYVETELVERNIASGAIHIDALLKRTPLGRLGRPGDIAAAISFLLSRDASWITGTTLTVDGGWLADGLGLGER